MKIQIKSVLGFVRFKGDFSSLAEALKEALKSGADLSSANLYGADLYGADLSSAVFAYASVSFLGHGECGRTLTAIQIKKEDAVLLTCGCFSGSEKELREYIADGEPKYAKTRTLALETVLALLIAENNE